MMNEIEAALSAEEWEEALPILETQTEMDAFCSREFVEQTERAALAALCLHDQPFGFTHYDVWLLRHAAEHAKPAHPELRDLADRIAALLPPRSEAPPP